MYIAASWPRRCRVPFVCLVCKQRNAALWRVLAAAKCCCQWNIQLSSGKNKRCNRIGKPKVCFRTGQTVFRAIANTRPKYHGPRLGVLDKIQNPHRDRGLLPIEDLIRNHAECDAGPKGTTREEHTKPMPEERHGSSEWPDLFPSRSAHRGQQPTKRRSERAEEQPASAPWPCLPCHATRSDFPSPEQAHPLCVFPTIYRRELLCPGSFTGQRVDMNRRCLPM
ncbi:hypothetical protein B0J12DRAFT_233071 [Macrophomina phaseolina]|uniref:Uncharacterized protein n=1 Tax=Macrophomina phaseolina TaxID=35725 RepID=A0ABQ8GQJ9_9PEZI|nr:hypothetical protein B0J12DRAFT_233071 [Macrophomina phaseolina]